MTSMQEPLTQLASITCTACEGTGLRHADPAALCDCIYRAVFRKCYAQFCTCLASAGSTPLISLEGRRELRTGPRGHHRDTWVRRNEDYVADFEMAARQALSPDLYLIFRWHYLLGASVRLLADRLQVDRGITGRRLQDIQVLVGRHIAASQPYSIYPPRQYMQSNLPALAA